MLVTHRYLGTSLGKYQVAFYLIYESYVDVQSALGRELSLAFERFARNLGEQGVVVRPFDGDIEAAITDVLLKSWTPAEKQSLGQTPGVLMIATDFDDFDPRQHRWAFFRVGSYLEGGHGGLHRLDRDLTNLADAITHSVRDPFEAAKDVLGGVVGAELFEAKPGVWGLSINLKQLPGALRDLKERIAADIRLADRDRHRE